jgi:hypothetical protein
MSLAETHDGLRLPDTLQAQLHGFRRRVWTIKMVEAACMAAFGIVAAFLLMFALDRVWDTPGWPRLALFAAAVLGLAAVPLALHRWVWKNRRLEQLARLLTRKHPHIGDQLLGIIELVKDDSEQARSRQLCEAAIVQVAEDAHKRDFRDGVPNPRHKLWAGLVLVPAAVVVGLFAFVPDAASNALARLAAPWKHTPRYTFAAVEPLKPRLVVAHGEPFALSVKLADKTVWKPAKAVVHLGGQPPIAATLADGRYNFELPAQIGPGTLDVRVGDSVQHVRVEPMLRPELTSVVADVALPDYLGRPGTLKKDVRGGSIALVRGSKASFAITASRDLSTAQIDGVEHRPAGATVVSDATAVDGSRKIEFRWKDEFDLAGSAPFTLTVTGRDDEAPTLSTEDLPRQKVVLDIEQLKFKVRAQDDFGVRQVGMEWLGVEDPTVKTPAKGERILGAGGNDKENLEVIGTFAAKSLGIEPQPINVRMFVEDYLPGRPRVYSPSFTFYVLNAEQHAIWLTEQLSKWHRQSLEVRDREMQLHEVNKQLRSLSPDELDLPETRRRIENQAAAERANGRRLSGLVMSGEDLVKQATRNPEFGVGHLEKWAEMLQILKDIAANRMPSVADLLKQAAKAPNSSSPSQQKGSKMAGNIRASSPASPNNPPPGAKPPQPGAPTVVDRESSMAGADKPKEQKPSNSKGSPAALRLPVTTLAGKPSDGDPPPPPPAVAKVDEAIKAQQDLLAEFDKIADELNRVLANLEGSTLVKRLKAASRLQYGIAGKISDVLGDAFGVAAPRIEARPTKALAEMGEQEAKGSHDVSLIMDDMQAYFERRQFMQFKTVLDEMRKLDAVGSIRQIGDDLKKENGVSIAQCEFWSDTLDRWAEDLVDPTKSGTCPGGKSKSSLPPSIVLEVLQILEGEVNLREETRVAEQARPAIASKDFARQATRLSETQTTLRDRTEKVTGKIRDLPDGDEEFGKEIQLLMAVAEVMSEASDILSRPDTGSEAIAAETEAIELLLASKRINPKGGGGGGSTPGGGGGGYTQDSALALLGRGANIKEVREDHGVSQATGDAGASLPEEFRSGLDEYFNRLERKPAGQ